MARGCLLVADAGLRFLERTREILEGSKYTMVAASDAKGVRAALAAGGIDAAFLSVSLPDISGYEIVREIKKQDADLPCVLLFKPEDGHQPTRVWQAGAENYLVRPLKRTELLFAVRDLLAMRNLLVQRAGLRRERARFSERAGLLSDDAESKLLARFYQFELFKKLLAIELKRARRYGFPLSILLVGLDDDGPPGGSEDYATESLASAVRVAIRDIDIPVTFSTENLLIVMPHTDKSGAKLVGERIRQSLRQSAPSTASVAIVSTRGAGNRGFSGLLQAAARALKEARRLGGDRVVLVGA